MTDHHETVDFVFALADRVQERQNSLRRDAFCFGVTARQFTVSAVQPAGLATWNKLNQAQPSRAEAELFQECSSIRCHAIMIRGSRW